MLCVERMTASSSSSSSPSCFNSNNNTTIKTDQITIPEVIKLLQNSTGNHGSNVDEGDLTTKFSEGCSKMMNTECRICQEEDDERNLESPCACNGTLKFAHRKCIQKWCNKKGDITCEICNQVYAPDYVLPPTRINPDVMTIDIRHAWGPQIDLRDARFLAFSAEHQFLEPGYEDYGVASNNSIAYLRFMALILMLILLIRQALLVTRDLGMVAESSKFFNFQVSVLQLAGFLLPCYVVTRSWLMILRQRRRQAHQDMTAPLSHYFIFTGHNSYLTGNQLSSDCSDAPIIQALERGVRVIELDIWPNSEKDDVLVLHGMTLTSPVDLRACLNSIKNHAFSASEYPVVITLEDHLTTDLQAKVAEMVHQIFGDILFTPDKDCLADFPSPESLKKRVIISTKPPKEYLKVKKAKEKGNDSSHEKDTAVEAWGGEIPNSLDDKDDSDEDSDDDDEDEDLEGDNVAPEYRSLIGIHAGKGKGGLDDWLKVDFDHKVRRLSLSEHVLEKAAEIHGQQIVRFTQRNILRVYPKGIRFDSSNYNPLIGWMHGAQMVAFNMQGYGRSLWLMQGMFRGNGGCGYVKKPEILLTGGQIFDPRVKLPVKLTLKITVFMGEGWFHEFSHTHFDAYSPPDFYVRIGIAGVGCDSIMKKSKTVEDSWNPVWNEEFEFPLTVPELALLRVEVHEYDLSEKDDFAGQTCFPVTEIRRGVRSVPLYTQKGDMYQSIKLLMLFQTV